MITKEMLNEIFYYEDGVLYNKAPRKGAVVGNKVGCICSKGYLRASVNYKTYGVHQLIFLMHHGFLPKNVDHKDGNKLNNRIDNLRQSTPSQNSYNTRTHKDSSTGIKNISKCKDKYRVRLHIKGKEKVFGYFEDIELAELVAEEARNKYHGEYANHGNKNEASS